MRSWRIFSTLFVVWMGCCLLTAPSRGDDQRLERQETPASIVDRVLMPSPVSLPSIETGEVGVMEDAPAVSIRAGVAVCNIEDPACQDPLHPDYPNCWCTMDVGDLVQFEYSAFVTPCSGETVCVFPVTLPDGASFPSACDTCSASSSFSWIPDSPGVYQVVVGAGFCIGCSGPRRTVTITVNGFDGACCIPSDTCQIMTRDNCTAAGGSYQGDGTDCGGGQVTVIDATGLGLSIPDDGYPGAGASHTLNMGDSFVLQDVDINVQISHTWTGDLIVEVSHLGTTVVIVNQPGDATDTPGSPFGCSEDNYDIILDDEGAGGTIEAQCSPNLSSPPNYTPNNPLSAFNGMDSAGGWTIDVFDSGGFDTGRLDGWSVHMERAGGGAGPCPDVCCEAPVATYPYCEGFESGFGEWTNATDFEWTRQSGSTPSSSTGPSSAHEGSYYVYTEASSHSNETAILQGCFDLDSGSCSALSFWYHMYGSDMGTLSVEVSVDSCDTWTEVWTKSGDQENAWHEAQVDLTPYSGPEVTIRFVGATGSSYRSDMALDDICVVSMSCGNGLFCDGEERCVSGTCVPGTNPCPGCDGDSDCSESCNEVQNNCTANDPNGCVGDDGEYCTVDDFCQNGTCAGSALNCADGVDCTDDSCDEVNNECVNDPNHEYCEDDLFCNGAETCDPSDDCQPGTHPCSLEECCDEVDDVCGVGRPADFDRDCSVDLNDYAQFYDCFGGPDMAPEPTPPITVQDCLDAFDRDADADVDLQDFAAFQSAFTGPY